MILITGLGPGDIARIPGPVLDILLDPGRTIIARTINHPAARQLAEHREVTFCDDLYEAEDTFESVYRAIAERVLAAGESGSVVYAVPGSPSVGEFAVREILERGEADVIAAESFVDAILAAVRYDSLERGLQILNGHYLPTPLVIDKPTIVGHLDRPEILADVCANLSRVLPEAATVRVFSGLGSADAEDWEGRLPEVDPGLAGFRTSLWIDHDAGGIVGAIRAMEVLRRECPWDMEQTHQSLTKYLIEEAYELIDAVTGLDQDDLVAYARVEEELGDVLLQVLFQAEIASQSGAFDIDDVAEVLRQKLVRRHPHVFGDVEVSGAEEVKSNWDEIKRAEKGGGTRSILEGIPTGLPAVHRAAKVQNRAVKGGLESLLPSPGVDEMTDRGAVESEERIGDALLGLVDLARRSGVDPEVALRGATERLESSIRTAESAIPHRFGPGEQQR